MKRWMLRDMKEKLLENTFLCFICIFQHTLYNSRVKREFSILFFMRIVIVMRKEPNQKQQFTKLNFCKNEKHLKRNLKELFSLSTRDCEWNLQFTIFWWLFNKIFSFIFKEDSHSYRQYFLTRFRTKQTDLIYH